MASRGICDPRAGWLGTTGSYCGTTARCSSRPRQIGAQEIRLSRHRRSRRSRSARPVACTRACLFTSLVTDDLMKLRGDHYGLARSPVETMSGHVYRARGRQPGMVRSGRGASGGGT